MPQLIISPSASNDLMDIWEYIADDNPVNADHFLERLVEKAQNLVGFSEIGLSRPELAAGLYSRPVDRYMLYYRVHNNNIELVRVLHGSRDVNLIFWTSSHIPLCEPATPHHRNNNV